jgi:Ca2+-binding EF-hand superfamily protein
MFATLDVDRDGVLGRSDFLRRVERMAQLRGWDERSAEYRRNAAYTLEEWLNLRESADVDEDGSVTSEEFLRFGDIFLSDRDAVRAYARGDVQLLFDAMDTDADERITLPEYRQYLAVSGVDPAAADEFFAHADLDRDGKITRAEMAHAFEEFLTSEDPDAVGNFLFGALD